MPNPGRHIYVDWRIVKNLFADIAAIRSGLERYGLWRRFICLIEMAMFSVVAFIGGIVALVFAPPEFQALTIICFAVALGFGALAGYVARVDYMLWQDARLAYQQSDEPPTEEYAFPDEKVA